VPMTYRLLSFLTLMIRMPGTGAVFANHRIELHHCKLQIDDER